MGKQLSAPAKNSQLLKEWLFTEDAYRTLENNLMGWMSTDTFISQVLFALNTPKLANCTPSSKYQSAHTCAAFQLLPTLGHIALIPRSTSCTTMIQWQGFKSLMERHPDVLEINAQLVHRRDSFSWDSVNNILRHEYDPFDDQRSYNNTLDSLQGAYLKIEYSDSSRMTKYHFISTADILKRRSCALTKDIWDKWPAEMAMKTVFRDAWGRRVVPIDPAAGGTGLAKAMEAEDNLTDPSRVVVEKSQAIKQSRVERLAGTIRSEPPVDDTVDAAPPPPPVEDDPKEETEQTETEEVSTRDRLSAELALCTTKGAVGEWYERTQKDIGEDDKDWLFGITESQYKSVKDDPPPGEEEPHEEELQQIKIKERIFSYKQVARVRQVGEEATGPDTTLSPGSQARVLQWVAQRLNQLEGRLV